MTFASTTTAATPARTTYDVSNSTTTIQRLLFTFYFSLGTITPFLPVYYRSLGHDGHVIGLLGAIKPFTTFVVGPFWAVVSDVSGNPMLILRLTLLSSVLCQALVAARSEQWYIMTMVFVTSIFSAPVKSLLDAMILNHIPDRSSFGRLRLWGQIGYASGTYTMGNILSSGSALSFLSRLANAIPESIQKFLQNHVTAYQPMFVVHAALAIPIWLCINSLSSMDMSKPVARRSTSDPASHNTKIGVFKLLQNPDIVLFFLLVLAIGINSGVSENFVNVRIAEVGGTSKDMGLSRVSAASTAVPVMWFSKWFIQRMSTDHILLLVLLFSVVRFGVFAFLTYPSRAFVAEALRGLTFSAYVATSTTHAYKISPPGLNATMLMVVNALYAGLGQSIGAMLGGKLAAGFGTSVMFRYVALLNVILLCPMFGFLVVQGRIHQGGREKAKKA